MNPLVKDKLSEAAKKLPLFVFGPLLSALGVSLQLKARLGVDPISLFIEGLANVLGTAYSNASLIYNASFIVLACIVAWKNIYIGTVLSGLLMSPCLKLYEFLFASLDPMALVMWQRFALFVVGQIILCIGMSNTVSLRFGLGAIDAMIFRVREFTHWDYKYMKIGADILYVIGGFLMGGVLGIGTVLSVFTTGPIVEFTVQWLNKNLLRRIGLDNPLNELGKKKKQPEEEKEKTAV